MNYLIKKILIVALFLFASIFIYAQTTIKYEYDAAGNRERRIVLPGKSTSVANDSASATTPILDWLEKMEITIYPNPTKALLTVKIKNIQPGAIGDMTIYNTEGKCFLEYDQLNSTNTLDLSDFSTGIYILRISSGSKSCEWKIVKE